MHGRAWGREPKLRCKQPRPRAPDLDEQFVEAARDGNDERVEALIDGGASCDATHDFRDPHGAGCSTMFWAVSGGIIHDLPSAQSKRS